MRTFLLLLSIVLWSPACAQSLFSFSNSPGEHGVGVRFVEQYDSTRSFKGSAHGRPIQTVVWYPAHKKGKPVSYGDYVDLIGWETNFGLSPAARKQLVDKWIDFVIDGKRGAQAQLERGKPMWAVRDAPPKAGSYPVVIYAPSTNNTAFENADLAEYLASHGYIVISSPTIGANGRYIQRDLKHAELQVSDIRFLITYANTLPQADMARVAVAGFSWGGMTNVLAAAKDSRIKALVCMDGAVRYYNMLVMTAGYAVPAKMKTPVLYLAQTPASMETNIKYKEDMSGSFLDGMVKADVYLLTMYPMNHVNFGSSFIRFDDPAEYREYTAQEVSFAYTLGTRYILNFLNGYLKADPAGLAYLVNRPVSNGAEPHSLVMDFRPAKP